MAMQGVGPNGALVFCMELLEVNMSWLINKLKQFPKHYLIFDFPGQAELYSHHTMVRSILSALEKEGARLCTVYLVDSHYANDPGKSHSFLVLVKTDVYVISTVILGIPTHSMASKHLQQHLKHWLLTGIPWGVQ
ncbi:GPN-loop GTPase 2 [Portunus trituberculatus]|uniref:GPN-loop GTPase 2 n=1 Tax=Portunus trituberculatus TaxID=210409 RepID=A0A5B7ITX1_PORTR|nr:GPN-loop GTPase 2 [Portunus trituberculatus]